MMGYPILDLFSATHVIQFSFESLEYCTPLRPVYTISAAILPTIFSATSSAISNRLVKYWRLKSPRNREIALEIATEIAAKNAGVNGPLDNCQVSRCTHRLSVDQDGHVLLT